MNRLEEFGEIVARELRDHALDDFDLLVVGHWKAPSVQALQRDLAALPPDVQAVARRALRRVIDGAIHNFLFTLHEAHGAGELKLIVGGEDVIGASDGLHGEPYGEDGWYARFSQFGEPPKEA